MRYVSRTPVAAGLLLLSFAATAGAAESAFVDTPRQSGPSRFVTGLDGKPVQLGVAAPDRPSDQTSETPGTVTIVTPSQIDMEPEEPSGRASRDGASDKEARGKAGLDPESSDAENPDDSTDRSAVPAPEDSEACDLDCDDE